MNTDGGKTDRIYRERAGRFAGSRDRCVAASRRLTHLRLAVFAVAILFIGSLDFAGGLRPTWMLGVAALVVLFLALIVYHSQVNRRRRWFDELAKLNEEGCARVARDWAALPSHDEHPPQSAPALAADLDLFGQASLTTLLGSVGTSPGRATLRDWLLHPADPDTIRTRQAAVAELAPLIDVREEITVRGRLMPKTTAEAVERFLAWAEGEPWLMRRRWPIWAARTLPPLTVALIALNVAGLVPYTTWFAAVTVNLAISFALRRTISDTFDRAFAHERAFQQYAALFRLLSQTGFRAPLLERLQAALSGDGVSAHRQMQRLDRLLWLADVRSSMLYGPIQALTLWDFHVLQRLEVWQRTAGRHARDWLAACGVVDALAALAALAHDNPGWAFPQIAADDPPILEARALGHPLLADDVRVANDVRIGPPGTFLLVTGSNMSGKSTLLRAIGTNVVLAGAGAPVCAAAMRLPALRIETSMRVQDSLQQGLSHFMAELERLKGVVAAARRAGSDGATTLLYLLDDIFQGTNTAERQIAARKVIAHLVAANAIGGVTSHDLQLADTEELSAACVPVHFSERVAQGPGGPEITFDYKLRPGFATSKNALKLLALVGLDTEGQRASGTEARTSHDTPDPTAS